MGGDVRMDDAGFDIGVRDTWQAALDSVEAAGGKPYADPGWGVGPSPRGAGFANWAREVAAQEAELGVFFDHVIVCTVTGSTHAGMVAGFALEGRADRRVIGIDASKTLDQTVAQVTRIANDTAEDRRRSDLRADEITIVDGYAGTATASPTSRRSRRSTSPPGRGMLTDPSTRANRWPA